MRHTPECWNAEHVVLKSNNRSDKSLKLLHADAEAISRALRKFQIEAIVDIGVGEGQLAEMLLDQHPTLELIGIDFSSRMLACAVQRLKRFDQRCKLILNDPLEVSKIPEGYHTFLLARTLHHMDLRSIVALMNRIRSHGGTRTQVLILERWAFTPKDKRQEIARSVRLAVSEAMFPGIGEFHHLSSEYKMAATIAGFKHIQIDWFKRPVPCRSIESKIRSWIPSPKKEILLSAISSIGDGDFNLSTMVMYCCIADN